MTFAPALLAWAPTVLGIASTGLAVAGSIAGAASEVRAQEQSAQVAEENKRISEENAKNALIRGQSEQYDQDQVTAQQLSEQLAIQSASGLSVNGKSQILTRKAARELGRIDALNVREAAEISAMAYRTQSAAAAQEAVYAREAKGSAVLSGFLGVGSSLIGGASGLLKAQPVRRTGVLNVPDTRLYQ